MNQQSALTNLIASSPISFNIARLPTNVTSRTHPVHRWFNFIAGFSPEFVKACLDITISKGIDRPVLLDPFSGCGTAPLTSRLLGMPAIAYEPHPFFSIISEAKVNSHLYWNDLSRIIESIRCGIHQNRKGHNTSNSIDAFLGKMFDEKALLSLYSARRELADAGLDSNPLAILILSRILDYCCFAATDGIYKAPTSTKRALTPHDALNKVIETLIRDEIEATKVAPRAKIHKKTSQYMSELTDSSVDLIVTSPPYLNNFDFAEMTRMYLYFWGIASSWGEITDLVRSQLVVNTTTGLKGHKKFQEQYRDSLPSTIKGSVDNVVKLLLEKRAEKSGKKEYDLLVYPYLSQMQQIIRECYRVSRSGSSFHMMVSDAALYGIHLPAPQWLVQVMYMAGFTDIQCELVRPRGHRWVLEKRKGSVEGLGEYHIYGRVS